MLILAAGASRRMGGADKLLLPIGAVPMLRHVVLQALATGAPVWVALRPEDAARRQALAGLALTEVAVPDAAQGMSRALVRGMAAIAAGDSRASGLMVLPADMPGLTAAALGQMIAAFQDQPTRLTQGAAPDGRPGHPVIFPRDLWGDLAQVTGDVGGRDLLRRHADRLRVIPLPGRMAHLDLDTPEDWADWQRQP